MRKVDGKTTNIEIFPKNAKEYFFYKRNNFPNTNPNTIPNTQFVATRLNYFNQYIQVVVWQRPEH